MTEREPQNKLTWPLKENLQVEPSPATKQRVEDAVRARLFARGSFGKSRNHFTISFAAFVSLAFLAWISWSGPSHRDEALQLATGGVFEKLQVRAGAPEKLTFVDGSSITVHENTLIESLGSDQRKMISLLSEGKVSFKVEPGGDRQWIVEAGLLSVEVVGTEFTVERSGARAGVAVSRGTVLVRSPRLPNGVVRLSAGEKVEVLDSSPAPAPSQPSASAKAPLEPSHLPEKTKAAPDKKPANPVPSQQNTRGADEHLRLADSARMEGDDHAAAAALLEFTERFPNDPRASISIFQLSVLEVKIGRHSSAELRLNRLLQGSLAASLREDVYLRLIELESTSSPEKAHTHAQDYLREFPNGRHASRIVAMLPAHE